MGKITVIKKKYILGRLFVVIISPLTNHFTAGVIEFQAEITVYCENVGQEVTGQKATDKKSQTKSHNLKYCKK